MSSPEEILSALGLDHLIGNRPFRSDAAGALIDPLGVRVVCAPPEMMRSFRFIFERESPGAWSEVFRTSGRAAGEYLGQHLDRELARLGQPTLSALPLETCVILIERYFAVQGWGILKLDLSDAADHGLVIARLEHSSFAEALSDVNGLVDPLAAGLLQGFIEYISGQSLGCEEIACVRTGAPRCTFVITAQERLDPVIPLVGRQTAEEIITRLKS